MTGFDSTSITHLRSLDDLIDSEFKNSPGLIYMNGDVIYGKIIKRISEGVYMIRAYHIFARDYKIKFNSVDVYVQGELKMFKPLSKKSYIKRLKLENPYVSLLGKLVSIDSVLGFLKDIYGYINHNILSSTHGLTLFPVFLPIEIYEERTNNIENVRSKSIKNILGTLEELKLSKELVKGLEINNKEMPNQQSKQLIVYMNKVYIETPIEVTVTEFSEVCQPDIKAIKL